MPYRLFHDFFPAIAERETRTLIVPPGSTEAALPVGEYGLAEMFCDGRGGDYRPGDPLDRKATIAYSLQP